MKEPAQPKMRPCLSCESTTRSHIYEKDRYYFYFCHRCNEALPNDQIQKLIQIELERKQKVRHEIDEAAQTLADFEKKKREEAFMQGRRLGKNLHPGEETESEAEPAAE